MVRLIALLVLLALLVPGSAAADGPEPPAQHQLTVMTRNVYHGVDAEIFRVPGAGTFQELLNRVAAVYVGYQARNFPERAQALAAEIDATRPALIGLQEAIQVAQAGEIANGPAATDLPVALAADVNASPLDPIPSAYSALVEVGFVDAWGDAGSGFTCCQADDLSNPASLLSTRIDVLMTRPAFDLHAIAVTGDEPADRTPSGLWPSDHAGVVATLGVP